MCFEEEKFHRVASKSLRASLGQREEKWFLFFVNGETKRDEAAFFQELKYNRRSKDP